MSKILYLDVAELTEVQQKDVFLKDVAKLYCDDRNIMNKCSAIKIKTIHLDRDHRYVESVLDIIQKIDQVDAGIQVNSVGKVDYIIDYQHKKAPSLVWQWMKTLVVCAVCFFGAAFAIMTFNNDVNAVDVFKEVYLLITGEESSGFTILELSYSIGLAVGIVVFFNHFSSYKLNTDPTPIEVEMRLYEDNVSKTLIQNNGRKESGIDVT